MSKFCVHCGTPLQEGQRCTCRGEGTAAVLQPTSQPVLQSASQPNSTPLYSNVQSQPNQFLEFVKDSLLFGLRFFKQPLTLTREVASNQNFSLGLFFIALQSICVSSFIIILIQKTLDTLLNFFGKRGVPISEGLLSDIFKQQFSIPYSKIFFNVFIASCLLSLLLTGILFCLSKLIFRGMGTYKSIIGIVGVSTAPFSAALAIGILCLYIFPVFSIYLILFSTATVLSIMINYVGMEEICNLPKDKVALMVSIVYGFYCFIVFLLAVENIKSGITSAILKSLGGGASNIFDLIN